MAKCSIVMVSYHTGPVLFAAVKAALAQGNLAELILVDNGNPPDMLARLQQMTLGDPRLKIVTSHGNGGFARGCNLGVKQATGEYVLLLNPRCLLPPDALAETMNAFNEIIGMAVVGCRLIDADGKEKSRRGLPSIRKALGIEAVKGFFIRANAQAQSGVHAVEAVPDAFLCTRRGDYERLSGLDERFFLHGAALDFCRRAALLNAKIVCTQQLAVTMMPPDNDRAPPRYAGWQEAQEAMRYLAKHEGGRALPGAIGLAGFALRLRALKSVLRDALGRRRQGPAMTHGVAAKRLMILAGGLADLPEGREFYGRTVLVTGATSQVGLSVVRRLIASGAAVLAISRADAIPFQHAHLRWIKGDLTDRNLHLEGYLADAVVHCAPLWHLPATIGLLADAEVGRVIAFGSTSIFAKAMSRNGYEKDIVVKLSKAEADIAAACGEFGIRWTILRPTVIYGVGLDVSITALAKFIRRFGFFPVYPPAFGRRQPVHADDLALAVMQAMDAEASFGKAYNLSGGEIVTYREMLERLFALCRRKPKIIATTVLPFLLDVGGVVRRKKHINGEIARRMNDDLIFFHDEAKQDFGFRPRAFLSGGMRDIEGF